MAKRSPSKSSSKKSPSKSKKSPSKSKAKRAPTSYNLFISAMNKEMGSTLRARGLVQKEIMAHFAAKWSSMTQAQKDSYRM